MKKTISNWKEFVIAKDVKKLEAALNDDGFIDENGYLELSNAAADYTKEFWESYGSSFNPKILEIK